MNGRKARERRQRIEARFEMELDRLEAEYGALREVEAAVRENEADETFGTAGYDSMIAALARLDEIRSNAA